MARRITQITSCGVSNNQTTQCNAFIHALCDDGTVWLIRDNDDEWLQLPEIPDAPKLSETGQRAPNKPSDEICPFCRGRLGTYCPDCNKFFPCLYCGGTGKLSHIG